VTFLALGAFVAVVSVLAWYSHRRGQPTSSCCAPPDPRHDLRMRAAFEEGPGHDREGPSGA
jgi:hypothetical protein